MHFENHRLKGEKRSVCATEAAEPWPGDGYLSYESILSQEPVLRRCEGGFSKVDGEFTLAEFSDFQKCIVFDHRSGKLSFLDQSGDGDIARFDRLLATSALLPERSPCKELHAEISPEQLRCSLGKEAFKAGVKKLQEHIRAGDIFQAVLSERFEVDLSVTPFEIFRTLIETGSSAYQFFYVTPEKTLLGASPELLLKVFGDRLETHPIAGTRPRGADLTQELKNERDLLENGKENAEHLMLVDLSRNDLGKISRPGSVRVSERNLVKKFPSVMHLVSKVEGSLKAGFAPAEALASCFPAGTLSGAPKIRAMQLISEIEGTPRGVYGGCFFLSQGNGELEACISIRSMEIRGRKGFIQAGAGIVMDSDPDAEYEEVLHKSKTMRRAVAISELRREGK